MKLIDKYTQFKATKVGAMLIKSLPWVFGYIVLCALPLADMHTCELPNGDKIKHRKIYFYSIIGDVSKVIFWHSNANDGPPFSDKVWYSPNSLFAKSKSVENSGMNAPDDRNVCANYALFGELISLGHAGIYNTTTHQEFDLPEGYNLVFPYSDSTIPPLPKNLMPVFKELKAEIDILNLESSRVFFKLQNNTLVYESSLVKKLNDADRHSSDCAECYTYFDDYSPILAVWQSHSTDNGKTWSKPIITKDAKLFVIGKNIKEQPGVAKDKGTLRYIGWF